MRGVDAWLVSVSTVSCYLLACDRIRGWASCSVGCVWRSCGVSRTVEFLLSFESELGV